MTMTKSLGGIFLIIMIAAGLTLVGNLNSGAAQNFRIVSGTIFTDTTWTTGVTPIAFSGPVIVSHGATLTIDPGVTVDLSDYTLQVNGDLYARGTSSDNIIFTASFRGNGLITFSAVSASWNEQNGSGCIIENAVLNDVSISLNSVSPKLNNDSMTAAANAVDGTAIFVDNGSPTITNNIIKGDIEDFDDAAPIINNNSITGGIYAYGSITSTPIITNNIVMDGSSHNYGNGIIADGNNVYVADNAISNCTTGIQVSDGSSLIERNLVFNNTRGFLLSGIDTISQIIRNNTVTGNVEGFLVGSTSGGLTIVNNNIENNVNYSIHVINGEDKDVNFTYNWWGTADKFEINASIYDSKYNYITTDNPEYNDIIMGTVNFAPFLNESNPEALPNLNLTPTPTHIQSPTLMPTFSPTLSPSQTATATATPNLSQNPTPSNSEKPQTVPETSQTILYEVIAALALIIVALLVAIVVLYRKKKTI